ncbi:MAG: ABC transporter permease [Candidatus Omnitrophica bacterium]|nr:ABC transporter permease [Candidatus Omnitrophota bacterium]
MFILSVIRDTIASIGRGAVFMGDVLVCLLKGRVRWGEVFKQVFEQGVRSLFIVILVSLASGAVLAMQGRVMMERFGAKEFIAQLVALSLIRELSPIFTALVFSGKSGAGMAAELGTMSVNSQIQATRTLGVDPVEFLIVPRILACLIVLPILVVISMIVGIFGGYLIGVHEANIPSIYYINQTIRCISFVDFFTGFVKMFFFATLISWTCTYKGFFTSGGSMGVGRFTTQAVAMCYVGVIVSDTILTKIILTFWGN